jgi:hypothetical protein
MVTVAVPPAGSFEAIVEAPAGEIEIDVTAEPVGTCSVTTTAVRIG